MNGCLKFLKLRKSCPSILLLSLLLWPNISLAQENEERLQPSAELLDFLGSFDDAEAGWVDPLELLAMDDEDLEFADEQEKSDEK